MAMEGRAVQEKALWGCVTVSPRYLSVPLCEETNKDKELPKKKKEDSTQPSQESRNCA